MTSNPQEGVRAAALASRNSVSQTVRGSAATGSTLAQLPDSRAPILGSNVSTAGSVAGGPTGISIPSPQHPYDGVAPGAKGAPSV